ncbi:hypothetical protein PQ610_02010 [Tardisphaera miroshnichenkoae]
MAINQSVNALIAEEERIFLNAMGRLQREIIEKYVFGLNWYIILAMAMGADARNYLSNNAYAQIRGGVEAIRNADGPRKKNQISEYNSLVYDKHKDKNVSCKKNACALCL